MLVDVNALSVTIFPDEKRFPDMTFPTNRFPVVTVFETYRFDDMTCAWPNVVTFPVAKTFPRVNTLFVVTEFETYAFPLRNIVVAPA